MRSRSVITLAGNSAYRMEAVGNFDPPMMGMKQNRTVVEGKHLGACPRDMKPGDIAIGGMAPMNVRQMGVPGGREVPKK